MATPSIPAKLYPLRVFSPGYGPRIISGLFSNLDPINNQPSDLRAQPVSCLGNGPPSAATLPAGNGAYLVSDLYFDATNQVAWICSVGGSNAVAQWVQLGGGGGGGPYKAFALGAIQSGPNIFFTPSYNLDASGNNKIYKTAELQAVAGESIYNGDAPVAVGYANYDTIYYNSRTATDSAGNTETQLMVPRYQPGQFVIATWMSSPSVAGPGGLPMSYPGAPAGAFWLEVSPSREWCGVNAPNNFP